MSPIVIVFGVIAIGFGSLTLYTIITLIKRAEEEKRQLQAEEAAEEAAAKEAAKEQPAGDDTTQ